MTVYIVFRESCEDNEVYAVCGTETKAREMYEKLKTKLMEDTQHMIDYTRNKGREDSVYKDELALLSQCAFPDTLPEGFLLSWPTTEIYEVLE